MSHTPADAAPGSSIAAVERDTGLSKDTLRVWERRYNFPQPGRDAHGERLYPPEQVARLRLVKRLLDAGHRAGQVVGLAHAQLLALSQDSAPLPELVVLSFSASLHGKDVTHGLADLRRQLPADTEIWAGGACPVLHRGSLPGVRVLPGFAAIQGQLQQWRQTRA